MKKRNTLLILSAITLGGVIVPLASCKSGNADVVPENECKVEFVTTGSAAEKVKITYGQTKFEPGDELTFTLIPEDKVTIVSVTFNETPLSITDNNTYKTVLRKGTNIISVEASFTGTIQPTKGYNCTLLLADGIEKEFELTKNGSVYESEPITIDKTTRFGIFLKDGENYEVNSSISVLDANKCFAGIKNSPISKGPERDLNLIIQGGATYKFYYDEDADKPLYIVRSNITKLPDSADSLSILLDNGLSRGDTYNTRRDTKSVNLSLKTHLYDGTIYEETSSFNRYSNDTSLTSIEYKNDKASGKGIYYNQIKDNVLYNVDTFKDYIGMDADPEPIAYKYKIVDQKSGYRAYQRTVDEANYLLSQPVRHQGHVGAIISPVVSTLGGTNDGIKVTSTAKDGGFETKIVSRKISKSGGVGGNKYAVLTEGTLTFKNDGTLLKADVLAKEYDSSAYDFTNLELIPGKESAYKPYLDLDVTYTYGLDSLEAAPANDYLTKYFVQSIDSVIFKEAGIPDEGNNLYPNTVLDFDNSTESTKMGITVSPETALDKHQYSVISSSNKSVIDYHNGNTSVFSTKKKSGTSTVTIGNFADNTVTATADITVHNTIPLRYIFIEDPYSPINYPYFDKELQSTTNSALLMAGSKHVIRIGSAPNEANLDDIMIKEINGTITEIEPSIKKNVTLTTNENGVLFLNVDLSAIRMKKSATAAETLVVSFTGAKYASGYTEEDSTLTFSIMPEYKKSDLLGVWENRVNVQDGEAQQTLTSRITITEEKIVVESPESFNQLDIKKNPEFVYATMGDPNAEKQIWDLYPGSYALNVAGITDYSDPSKVSGFDFTNLYFNPFTKKLVCHLSYAVWAGLEAEHYSVVGFDGEEGMANVPEYLTKIA